MGVVICCDAIGIVYDGEGGLGYMLLGSVMFIYSILHYVLVHSCAHTHMHMHTQFTNYMYILAPNNSIGSGKEGFYWKIITSGPGSELIPACLPYPLPLPPGLLIVQDHLNRLIITC